METVQCGSKVWDLEAERLSWKQVGDGGGKAGPPQQDERSVAGPGKDRGFGRTQASWGEFWLQRNPPSDLSDWALGNDRNLPGRPGGGCSPFWRSTRQAHVVHFSEGSWSQGLRPSPGQPCSEAHLHSQPRHLLLWGPRTLSQPLPGPPYGRTLRHYGSYLSLQPFSLSPSPQVLKEAGVLTGTP